MFRNFTLQWSNIVKVIITLHYIAVMVCHRKSYLWYKDPFGGMIHFPHSSYLPDTAHIDPSHAGSFGFLVKVLWGTGLRRPHYTPCSTTLGWNPLIGFLWPYMIKRQLWIRPIYGAPVRSLPSRAAIPTRAAAQYPRLKKIALLSGLDWQNHVE